VCEWAAADGVHAGRSFAWPDMLVRTLGGNAGNRVIGVEAWVECRVVRIEVAKVGEKMRRGCQRLRAGLVSLAPSALKRRTNLKVGHYKSSNVAASPARANRRWPLQRQDVRWRRKAAATWGATEAQERHRLKPCYRGRDTKSADHLRRQFLRRQREQRTGSEGGSYMKMDFSAG
jgi:hypothetical protein